MPDSDRKGGHLPDNTIQTSILHWLSPDQVASFTPEALDFLAGLPVKEGKKSKDTGAMFDPLTQSITMGGGLVPHQGHPQVQQSAFHEAVHALDQWKNQEPLGRGGIAQVLSGIAWKFGDPTRQMLGIGEPGIKEQTKEKDAEWRSAYSGGDPNYNRMDWGPIQWGGLPPQEHFAIAGESVVRSDPNQPNMMLPEIKSRFTGIFKDDILYPSGGIAGAGLGNAIQAGAQGPIEPAIKLPPIQATPIVGGRQPVGPGGKARQYNQRQLRRRISR